MSAQNDPHATFREERERKAEVRREARRAAVRDLRRPKLSADEALVLDWYRHAKRRHAFEWNREHVSVLLVGSPHVVGVVNHQLDHIGGGLTSVIHARDVAHCHVLDREHSEWGERPEKHWAISAGENRLSHDFGNLDEPRRTLP
jgi:hypothetical protein